MRQALQLRVSQHLALTPQLQQAIKLAPAHADAHIGLATYHAEVIDKVGATIKIQKIVRTLKARMKGFQTKVSVSKSVVAIHHMTSTMKTWIGAKRSPPASL